MKRALAICLVLAAVVCLLGACGPKVVKEGEPAAAFPFEGYYCTPDSIGNTLVVSGVQDGYDLLLEMENVGTFSGSGTVSEGVLQANLQNAETGQPLGVTLTPEKGSGRFLRLAVATAADGFREGDSFLFAPTLPPAEEPVEKTEDESIWNYIGSWQDETSQRASMSVAAGELAENVSVQIRWGSSATEATVWHMDAVIDASTGKLHYQNGSKLNETYDANGVLLSEELLWSDGEGELSFDENGKLTWTDSREENAAACVFVRIYGETPSQKAFAEEYFRMIGSDTEETAVQTVYHTLRFANEYAIWNVDAAALQTVLLDAWETLTEEEREAFHTHLPEVVQQIDNDLADFEGAASVYEEADIQEEMQALLEDAYAKASWRKLIAGTKTAVAS